MRKRTALRAVIIAGMAVWLNCLTVYDPTDTGNDPIEFESVWQYCKAWSIYQDSSIYNGRIPSDPFQYETPELMMYSIRDTLRGNPNYSYTRYYKQLYASRAAGVLAPYDTTYVFLDSLSKSTAILTITTFEGYYGGAIFNQFSSLVSRIKGFSNIVIDVRNNTGGYIDESENVIQSMVPSGTDIIQMRNREYDSISNKYVTMNWRKVRTSVNPSVYGKKYVVLMNQWTASASEIFVAALYEGDKTTKLIGTRSYGKGMGQIILARRTRKPVQITFLQLKGVSPRIGDYHQRGIDADSIPDSIKTAGSSITNGWKRDIFYAAKMVEPNITASTIKFPPQRIGDSLNVQNSGCFKVIKVDD